MEITDQYGEIERLLVLKNQDGDIIDIDLIDSIIKLGEELKQKQAEDKVEKQLVLSIFNQDDYEVGQSRMPLQVNRRSRASRVTFTKN